MYQLDFYYSRVGFSFSFGLLIILCICTVYSAILFPTLFDNFSKLKTRLKQTWEIGWLTRQLIADFGNLTQKYSTSTDFTSHSINMVSTKHAVVSMYADPAIDQTNQKGRRYRKVRNCELPLFWRYSNSCLSFGSVMVPLCESRLKRCDWFCPRLVHLADALYPRWKSPNTLDTLAHSAARCAPTRLQSGFLN